MKFCVCRTMRELSSGYKRWNSVRLPASSAQKQQSCRCPSTVAVTCSRAIVANASDILRTILAGVLDVALATEFCLALSQCALGTPGTELGMKVGDPVGGEG